MQVDDPTDGVAILQRVMDLTQNTAVDRVTEASMKMPDDSGRDAGMDANARGRLDKDGASLGGTDPQARIRHATSTTTTKEFDDSTLINVDALEPGSPESPIYVDTLECIPSSESPRSNSPDIPNGPITHTQLRFSIPRGNETPFCCHANGTPIRPNEVGNRNRTINTILTSDIPPGFIRNTGLSFIPFPITGADGITQHADYIQIVMIDDPFMLAIVRGNPHVYRQALHIIPCISECRCPRYDPSDLVIFRAHHDRRNTIDDAVHNLGDKSATAEVHRWRNLMIRRAKVERNLKKVLQETCDIGEEQEQVQTRMESADLLARLDKSVEGIPFGRRGRRD